MENYRYDEDGAYYDDFNYEDVGLSEDYLHEGERYDASLITENVINNFDFKLEWENIIKNCMGAIAMQALSQLKILLLLCLGFRIVTLHSRYLLAFLPENVLNAILHVISGISGITALYFLNEEEFIASIHAMLLFLTVSYSVLFIFYKAGGRIGTVTTLLTVCFILLGEYFSDNPKHWHQIRGMVLMLSMKIISIAFDCDRGVLKSLPNPITYFGYMFHQGTLLFGPWISIVNYKNSVENSVPMSLNWVFCVIKSLGQAIICLLLSSCVFSYLFIDGRQPDLPAVFPLVENNWMSSYKTAISFHFSHYYICYLSQATCLLSGVGAKIKVGVNSWGNFTVTKPLSVEIPFSMLSVVVAWNIPMSRWLKTYIFETYSYMGRSTAILLTYAASAILHGLSFHLAAVLLSLSLYTYVEYELRSKLSRVFNCPYIQSRPKMDATETNPPLWAYIFNFVWIVINLMHLSYLGSMFHSDDGELEVEGYAMQHTITKWANLNFFSHIFAFCCLLFNHLI